MLNTLKAAKRMKEAGIQPEMAEAFVETLEELLGEPLTRDIFEARAETIESKIEAMGSKIGTMVTKDIFGAKVAAIDSKMETMVTKDVFNATIGAIKSDMQAMILKSQLWIVVTVIVSFAGVMAKLFDLF